MVINVSPHKGRETTVRACPRVSVRARARVLEPVLPAD